MKNTQFRFENKIFLFFLTIGALACDLPVFNILNIVVKQFYLKIFTPYFARKLGLEKVDILKIIPRHSVFSRNFNVFVSDLDFTIVTANTATQDQFQKLVIKYQMMRQTAPFLGELEIYTEHEFEERERLIRKNSELFSFFRALRKIKWEFDKFNSAPDFYHRYKAKRSIKKTASTLGHDLILKDINCISQIISNYVDNKTADFVSLKFDYQGEGFSNFLGWNMTTQNSIGSPILTLSLSNRSFSILIGLLLDSEVAFYDLKNSIEQIRVKAELKIILLDLIDFEILNCVAKLRQISDFNFSQDLLNWIQYLKNLRNKYEQ